MDGGIKFAVRELMHDLAWLPSDLNCEEKRRLAEEYLDATTEWSEACRSRWMDLGDRLRQSYYSYRGLDDGIDEARLRTAAARLALERHIAAHKCHG